MKINTSPVSNESRKCLVTAFLAAIAVAPFLLPIASWAQSCSDPQSVQGCSSPNERDSFSGGGNGLGVMDLIHKAQLGSLTNIDEFTAEQQQNINSSADAFRAQQLQRMQQGQQQGVPIEPAIAPTPQN